MDEQRKQDYDLRSDLAALQRQLREASDPAEMKQLLAEITAIQQQMVDAGAAAPAADAGQPTAGRAEAGSVPAAVRSGPGGPEYDTSVQLRMLAVPTSIYHLFDVAANPLLTCTVTLTSAKKGRVRIIAYIEDYSARAVQTVDLVKRGEAITVDLLPTLFPGRVHELTELTRATVNVMVENLTEGTTVEHHLTLPVWLLPPNSAPLQIHDPQTGKWQDMTKFMAALVTPHDRAVMNFLRAVLEFAPNRKLDNYRGNVKGQVAAVFNALKEKAELQYVDSVNDFNPDSGYNTQRVRLPRETLEEKLANCADGTLLYASLLEAIGINPVLVFVPEHVFVGWQKTRSGDEWGFVETTKIGDATFEEAVEHAEVLEQAFKMQREALNNPDSLRTWSVRELRTEHKIWPTT